MKKTIFQCDICGSEKNVESLRLPMYRMFDSCDGRTFFDKPHIVLDAIDVCEECLKKSTNIFDKRVMGYGDVTITINPNLNQ